MDLVMIDDLIVDPTEPIPFQLVRKPTPRQVMPEVQPSGREVWINELADRLKQRMPHFEAASRLACINWAVCWRDDFLELAAVDTVWTLAQLHELGEQTRRTALVRCPDVPGYEDGSVPLNATWAAVQVLVMLFRGNEDFINDVLNYRRSR